MQNSNQSKSKVSPSSLLDFLKSSPTVNKGKWGKTLVGSLKRSTKK